jgi:Peptidase family S41
MASRDAADSLTEAELQQVIELLRDNHIRPEALSDTAIARAGVQGLLDRLGAGARVFPKTAHTPPQRSPFRSEAIEDGVAYLRLGDLGTGIAALDKAFDDFGTKVPSSLILDLRATPPDSDFELAAEICRRFVPRGRVLFSVKRPKANDEEILTSRDDPRWRGLLVVLVDHDTAGSAEIIAAVLRTHLRALVVGQKTQGEAAQFDDIPLPSGKVLRIAVGEVTLPDSTPVFPGGLTPDVLVAATQEKTDELLRLADAGGVAPLIAEPVRVRMTEAALIAGTNPEFDAAQERQRLKAEGREPQAQVRDETLQRGLDYVKSVAVIEAAKKKRP